VAIKSTKLSTMGVIGLSMAVTIIALIILVVAGRSFYIRIGHNSRVLSAKQTAEKQLETNLSNLPQLAQAYQALGTKQSLAEQALPDTDDFPATVATIEAIAGASNVGLVSVSPQTVTATSTSTTTPTTGGSSSGAIISTPPAQVSAMSSLAAQPTTYSINIKGPYSGVLTFLSDLQLSARPIKITDIQLSGTNSSLTGTIGAQTYFFLPQVLVDKSEVVK